MNAIVKITTLCWAFLNKTTRFHWRAELILGALLFFVTPSGCVLPDNGFPGPLKWLAFSVYSRLSVFWYSVCLFQPDRNIFSCPVTSRLASQKSKSAFERLTFRSQGSWLAGQFVLLPDYFCVVSYESWLQTAQGSFKSCIIFCSQIPGYCRSTVSCCWTFPLPQIFFVLPLCSFSVVAVFHTSCVDLLQLYDSGIFLNNRLFKKVTLFNKSPLILFTFLYERQLSLCIVIFLLLRVSLAVLATTGRFLVTSWRLEKKSSLFSIPLLKFQHSNL